MKKNKIGLLFVTAGLLIMIIAVSQFSYNKTVNVVVQSIFGILLIAIVAAETFSKDKRKARDEKLPELFDLYRYEHCGEVGYQLERCLDRKVFITSKHMEEVCMLLRTDPYFKNMSFIVNTYATPKISINKGKSLLKREPLTSEEVKKFYNILEYRIQYRTIDPKAKQIV